MREYAVWVRAALAAVVMVIGTVVIGCGGKAASPVLDSRGRVEEKTFTIHSAGMEAVDGLDVMVRRSNNQTVATVVAIEPVTLEALVFELWYDAATHAPMAAEAGGALWKAGDCLTLQVLDVPGEVSFGQVPIDEQVVSVGAGTVLAEVLFADGPASGAVRAASAVPVHQDALSPLVWDGDAGELVWRYVNPGDYDQDGEVGIMDLTPLARHLKEAGPFAFTSAVSLVDGNRNGEINIDDLTVIGQYFGNSIDGYNLYGSDEINDVPVGYAEESAIDALAYFGMAEASGDAAVDRLWFTQVIEEADRELFYWVRPVGDQMEGTRSNVCRPASGGGGEGYNLAPVARLGIEYSGTSVPLAVTFDATASDDPDGEIVYYEWDFEGDGLYDSFSTGAVAHHTYIQPGTYGPLVRVTDNQGAMDAFQVEEFTVTESTVENVPPVADLMATVFSGEAPLTVGLLATGSVDVDGYIAKYEWDFDGDGEYDLDSGTDPTVLHVFSGAGQAYVRLKVTDDDGESDMDTLEITITKPAQPNQPPVALFSLSPATGHIPISIVFDAAASYDPDGEIEYYLWDVETDGKVDMLTLVPFMEHEFTEPGDYQVTLTVRDDNGLSGTHSQYVNLSDELMPVADIEIEQGAEWGTVPHTVVFNASGSYDPNGDIVEYWWDWNCDGIYDGQSSSGLVGHTFSETGTYGVRLQVVDNDGNTAESLISIGVSDGGGLQPWGMRGQNPRNTSYSPYAGPDEASVLWSTCDYPNQHGGTAVDSQGRIYVVSPNTLYTYEARGVEAWQSTLAIEHLSDPAIDSQGIIYVAIENALFALHNDGSIKWSTVLEGITSSTPVIDSSGTIYAIGRYNNDVWAVNRDSTVKWHIEVDNCRLLDDPVIGHDGTLYVTVSSNSNDKLSIYALDSNGRIKWICPFDWSHDRLNYTQIVVDEKGTLYIGIQNHLLVVDIDGSIVNEYVGQYPDISRLAVSNKRIYFDTHGVRVCLNKELEEIWVSGEYDNHTEATTIIVDSNENSFFSYYMDKIVKCDKFGNTTWIYENPNKDRYTDMVLGADRVLYVCNNLLEITAIGENKQPTVVLLSSGSGVIPLSVQFNSVDSFDPDGSITLYEWDLDGDGYYELVGNDTSVSHEYTEVGIYNATVRITDNLGSSVTKSIEVRAHPNPDPQNRWACLGCNPQRTFQTNVVGPPNNNIKWSLDLGFSISLINKSLCIAANGTIYVCSDQRMYAINPDGSIEWDILLSSSIDVNPALTEIGDIICCCNDGTIYSIAGNGSINWSYNVGVGIFYSSPICHNGIILFGSMYEMIALDYLGNLVWQHQLYGNVDSAIDHNDNIYINNGILYSLNSMFEDNWLFTSDIGNLHNGPSIDLSNTIYNINGSISQHAICAINSQGIEKWKLPLISQPSYSPAIAYDGTLYVSGGYADMHLYAIATNGGLKWKYKTWQSVLFNPAIDRKGVVYFGTSVFNNNENCFYAVNPDGSTKWSYNIGGATLASPVISPDGTVYVTCEDGKLYAFGD